MKEKEPTPTYLSNPSKVSVSPALSKILTDLHAQLAKDYGWDYAYTILAKGNILSASNFKHGHITPKTE